MSEHICKRCGARYRDDHECEDLARAAELEERIAELEAKVDVLENLVVALANAHFLDESPSGHYTKEWVGKVQDALMATAPETEGG